MEERWEIWKERNERYEEILIEYEGMKFLLQRISSGLYVEADMLLNKSHCSKKNGGQEIIISWYLRNYIHPDYILSNMTFNSSECFM